MTRSPELLPGFAVPRRSEGAAELFQCPGKNSAPGIFNDGTLSDLPASVPYLFGFGQGLEVCEPGVGLQVFRILLELAAHLEDGRHNLLDVAFQLRPDAVVGGLHRITDRVPAVCHGTGQGIQGLGGVMEAHAVLGRDIVPEHLTLADIFLGLDDQPVIVGGLVAPPFQSQTHGLVRAHGILLRLEQLTVRLVLRVLHPAPEIFGRLVGMALTAGAQFRILERRRPPVAGHLLAFHALIRHVAVHAGHAGRSVRAVDPCFVFGVLHLDHGRLGDRMNPVRKLALEPGHGHCAVIFIHAVYLFGGEALFPREMRALGRAVAGVVEIVFHMALRAYQRTHFRAGQPGRVLARKLQIILEGFTVELKLHGFGIVAGGAADGVVVRHLIAELVDIPGPEIIPVLPDPFHHFGKNSRSTTA